ncbi:MAG: hypothetical protein VYB90_10000 [Actinomycetota bacterium]|uniref:hypothetical protein n=1 Tax=Mycobacterium sp. G7A2 TaxID=3317307 RepID=UPI001C84FEC3|nr:hypothetical protein [Mycolicibacterium aurantiacum]MEC9324158.1 hypothetical protein [Actinomycetota bacterium]
MRPRIVQTDDQIGFAWATVDGRPTSLLELVEADEEPDRLAATHLSALDDALIDAARRFGDVLGGGRRPSPVERDVLAELYCSLDRLCLDYARAADSMGLVPDVRAGQIVGTAALMSILARQPLGLLGPAPLDGELDEPTLGVVGGFGDMVQVDPARPWKGGRWVLRTEDGARLPLTLAMLLFDSSGVNRDAARREHAEALARVTAAAGDAQADRFDMACALDWLLYDWLMAHRVDADSAEIVVPKDREDDAAVVVAAVAASVAARATFDPALGGR